MNTLIENIIQNQLSHRKQYNNKDLSSLDSEDILVNISGGNYRLIGNVNLNTNQELRLKFILPYIHYSCISHNINNLKFILSIGDKLKKDYTTDIPVLCLTKDKNINGILIPNIDFFTNSINYFLAETLNDDTYENKLNQSIFIGSSTGEINNNPRVLYCKKCIDNKKHNGYIHNLCQHNEEDWLKKYDFISKILHSSISISDQLKYKIVVNIDGNTTCWSRLYWQMNSNSLPVYINKTESDIQFFDFIDSSNCYVSCSLENSFEVLDKLLAMDNKDIMPTIENGKQYCSKIFSEYQKNSQQFLQEIIDKTILGIVERQP
jgi:mRNA-degrading endonuclease HigB of HigAB toxin-antitoxin module